MAKRRRFKPIPKPEPVFHPESARREIEHLESLINYQKRMLVKSHSPANRRIIEREIQQYDEQKKVIEHRLATFNLKQTKTVVTPEQSPPTSVNIQSTRLSWKPLGAKLASFNAVRDYVQHSQSTSHERSYDLARLELLYNMQPERVYVGQDEFEGYIVFVFSVIAILECPVVGNALYALRGQWQILARKSKAELLEDKSGNVTRIEHRGDWPARVRALIEQT